MVCNLNFEFLRFCDKYPNFLFFSFARSSTIHALIFEFYSVECVSDGFDALLLPQPTDNQFSDHLSAFIEDEEYDTDALLEDIEFENEDGTNSNIYQTVQHEESFQVVHDYVNDLSRYILGVVCTLSNCHNSV